MKPTFKINRLGAKDTSLCFDKILTYEILKDIAKRITGSNDYCVVWQEKRNTGRLVIFETDKEINYISLSQNGRIESRNNYFQSVATALGLYLSLQKTATVEYNFYFYFLPFSGNNKTPYMEFFYDVMKTLGIRFLNAEIGIRGVVPKKFCSVKDIIDKRNELKKQIVATIQLI